MKENFTVPGELSQSTFWSKRINIYDVLATCMLANGYYHYDSAYLYIEVCRSSFAKRHCSVFAILRWWTQASERCHWPFQTLTSTWCSHFPVSNFHRRGRGIRWWRSHVERTPCRWAGSRCTDRPPAHTGWCWSTDHHQCGMSVPCWRSAGLSHISGTRGRHPRIVVGCSQRILICNWTERRTQSSHIDFFMKHTPQARN